METVTLQTISAFPGKLTDMAADPAFTPRVFRPYVRDSNNTQGLAVSISDFLTYSAFASSQGEQRPAFDVENASVFQRALQETCTPDTVDWWPDDGADFKLLAFSTRKNKLPAGMVLVSPKLSNNFQQAVENAQPFDYTTPCPMAFNLFDQEPKMLPEPEKSAVIIRFIRIKLGAVVEFFNRQVFDDVPVTVEQIGFK